MTPRKFIYAVMALTIGLAFTGIVVADVPVAQKANEVVDDADTATDDGDSDDPALDDGRALLPKAKLTFEQAGKAALVAAPGLTVEEVDLEYQNETLVFDVDMGDKTVIVDATSGKVMKVSEKTADKD